MITEQILSAVGLVGIGGLIKSFFDFLIASRKAKQDSQHSLKELRYKALILLCFALVFYDKEKSTLIINRPDIASKDRLVNEIHAEFINMSLYGSDDVLIKLKEFFKNQDVHSLNCLAMAMRKDLYSIKTKLQAEHFDIS